MSRLQFTAAPLPLPATVLKLPYRTGQIDLDQDGKQAPHCRAKVDASALIGKMQDPLTKWIQHHY